MQQTGTEPLRTPLRGREVPAGAPGAAGATSRSPNTRANRTSVAEGAGRTELPETAVSSATMSRVSSSPELPSAEGSQLRGELREELGGEGEKARRKKEFTQREASTTEGEEEKPAAAGGRDKRTN